MAEKLGYFARKFSTELGSLRNPIRVSSLGREFRKDPVMDQVVYQVQEKGGAVYVEAPDGTYKVRRRVIPRRWEKKNRTDPFTIISRAMSTDFGDRQTAIGAQASYNPGTPKALRESDRRRIVEYMNTP